MSVSPSDSIGHINLITSILHISAISRPSTILYSSSHRIVTSPLIYRPSFLLHRPDRLPLAFEQRHRDLHLGLVWDRRHIPSIHHHRPVFHYSNPIQDTDVQFLRQPVERHAGGKARSERTDGGRRTVGRGESGTPLG